MNTTGGRGEIFPWQIEPWQQFWRAVQKKRLPHAILILGATGIGKTQFAAALAHVLLCRHPTLEGDTCGECRACHLIKANSHPDLITISPEPPGHVIKVDQIRELVHGVNETSQQGGFKIVVIPQAHNMNHHAANSLLKTLEEPTPHTVFLLLSEQERRLQATITSRCQKIILKTPNRDLALHWLQSQLPPASRSLTIETKAAVFEAQADTLGRQATALITQADTLDRQATRFGTPTSTLEMQAAALVTQTDTLDRQSAGFGTPTGTLKMQAAALGTQTGTLGSQATGFGTKTGTLDIQATAFSTEAVALHLAEGAPLKALSLLTDNDTMAYRQAFYDGLVSLTQGQADPLQLAAQWQERDLTTLFHLLFYWLQDLLRLQTTATEESIINIDYRTSLTKIATILTKEKVLSYQSLAQERYAKTMSSLNLNRQLLLEELLIHWRLLTPR